MHREIIIYLAALFILANIAGCGHSSDETPNGQLAEPGPVVTVNAVAEPKMISTGEELLSDTENGYDPHPSPDGSLIAYVRTGWGRAGGSGGVGRSNLLSEINVMDISGNIQTKEPLSDAFLYGWSSDGKSLNCFRDWQYSTVSLDGTVLSTGHVPPDADNLSRAERVSFSPRDNSVFWVQSYFKNVQKTQTSPGAVSISSDFVRSAIQTPAQEVASYTSTPLNSESLLVPSPNDRYIAVAPARMEGHLLVFDRQNGSWADLGKMTIHPDDNWDYIKPSWDPWFADSTQLVFVTKDGIVKSSPDGHSKQLLVKPKEASGIPVPSPDGLQVAYVTFEPRPMKVRNDLKFWGGTTIWIVSSLPNSKAMAVTTTNSDETYTVRWVNNNELVFDRIADEPFHGKARLWKVRVRK